MITGEERNTTLTLDQLNQADLQHLHHLLKHLNLQLQVEEDNGDPYLLFVNNKGQPTPLTQVITSNQQQQLRQAFGFIVKQPDETSIQVEERGQWAEETISEVHQTDGELLLLTLASWQQLINHLETITEPVEEEVPDVPESLATLRNETLQYLETTLVGQGIRIIPTREMLPELPAEVELPDFLLVKEADTVTFAELPMVGWKAPGAFSKDYDRPTIYGNVCAVLITEETSIRKRKDTTRRACNNLRSELKNYFPIGAVHNNEQINSTNQIANFTVLVVDPPLLEHWQTERTSPLATAEELDQYQLTTPTKRQLDYGFPEILLRQSKPPELFNHYFMGPNPRIGDYHNTFVARYSDDINRALLIDHGWNFGGQPALNNLANQLQYSEGIYPFLREGLNQPVRRLYRTDLLELSLRPGIIRECLDHPLAPTDRRLPLHEFVLLELFHRLGWQGLAELIKTTMPAFEQRFQLTSSDQNRLRTYLQQRHAALYQQKTIFDAHLLTHIYQDHAIGSALVRPEIMRIGSTWTRAFGLTDHDLSSQWYVRETLAMKDRSQGRQNPLPIIYYPYSTMKDGETIEVAPSIYLTAFETTHSIPGTLAYLIEVEHHNKMVGSVLYCGDYKNADFFDRVAEHNNHIGMVFLEGTNPSSAKKESSLYTEEDVAENFGSVMNQYGASDRLMVVDLAKNNYLRLENFMNIINQAGRKVVLSPKIINRILRSEFHLRKGNIQEVIDYLRDNGVHVWGKPSTSVAARDKFALSILPEVTQDELTADAGDYVLIRGSAETPEKLQGLYDIIWCWSGYGVYDDAGQAEADYRQGIAQHNDWTFIHRGLHASGHTPIEDFEHDTEGRSVGAKVQLVHPEKIVIQHSFRPGEVKDTLRTFPGLKDTTIIYQHRNNEPGKIEVPNMYKRSRRIS